MDPRLNNFDPSNSDPSFIDSVYGRARDTGFAGGNRWLFMLFPIYNAIQSLDTNQIEAAEDLGAPWWRTHLRVILPHAKPGIASGSVMVFMLSAGSLLVPVLLGSTESNWFTQVIQQWMFEGQDWNTGSAYAFILLILCTVFVSTVMRIFRVKLSDIAK
ncbi:MAG: ABC transporter permease subunit [Rhodobacteraceae bacterium]|nr:ABC transporter permease subunit [Paracoccaceae bacterium]